MINDCILFFFFLLSQYDFASTRTQRFLYGRFTQNFTKTLKFIPFHKDNVQVCKCLLIGLTVVTFVHLGQVVQN